MRAVTIGVDGLTDTVSAASCQVHYIRTLKRPLKCLPPGRATLPERLVIRIVRISDLRVAQNAFYPRSMTEADRVASALHDLVPSAENILICPRTVCGTNDMGV